MQITDGTISNINLIAYSFDSSTYSYVGTNGWIFVFNSVEYNFNYGTLAYSILNVTFDKIYSKSGGAFYFGSNSGLVDPHNTEINLSNIIIRNSFAYSSGLIWFNSGLQTVKISNCLFTSNFGVTGESELRIVKSGGLEVYNTTFSLFSSKSITYGQSITFLMTPPFSFTAFFNLVTFQWSSTIFNHSNYVSYINSNPTIFVNRPPIYLNAGSLSTISSTFYGCYSSNQGGVIYADAGSQFTENSSTFKENAALEGGAIYFNQAIVNLVGTTFINNYAKNGGAIMAVSKSVIQSFNIISWTSNYVTNVGGWSYMIGGTTFLIEVSRFESNFAVSSSSAIYCLGTGKGAINNSIFR